MGHDTGHDDGHRTLVSCFRLILVGVLSASDENLYYAEDQQLKIENVSSEREIAVPTESNSSYEQAEVVSGNEASRMEV